MHIRSHMKQYYLGINDLKNTNRSHTFSLLKNVKNVPQLVITRPHMTPNRPIYQHTKLKFSCSAWLFDKLFATYLGCSLFGIQTNAQSCMVIQLFSSLILITKCFWAGMESRVYKILIIHPWHAWLLSIKQTLTEKLKITFQGKLWML